MKSGCVRSQGCTTSSKPGAAHGIERAFLDVHDVLRVRVVVDQPDEERTAEREAARLRIGHVAELVDDRLDACARVSSCTSGDWLMTRETVFFETLARRAMSLIVARRPANHAARAAAGGAGRR